MDNKSGIDFERSFKDLTGYEPFPWQEELYRRIEGDSYPSVCTIPTGLGKTSVIAVWLIALSNEIKVPRRLVYIVNRRTVVDQTTYEVERLRQNIGKLGIQHLGISTLRGQFADNHEWSTDPSKPAVICGTVDMIGSRLLFEGYRIGFKSRPLHAGFLGQDALLVHDEAHLEPAFQHLIETIEIEQQHSKRTGDCYWPKLRVMALSATARSRKNESTASDPFKLTQEDAKHPIVKKRIEASKNLELHSCKDEKKLPDQIAELAIQHQDSKLSVVIFVRKVDDVDKVVKWLTDKRKGNVAKGNVQTLTGTMRGLERDELVRFNEVFVRFMPKSDQPEKITPAEGTVYLVCTSAGEVGVNISADHMVCDLSTFDSMAQRLGRVNRFGDRDDTHIDVVHPESFDNKKPNPQCQATLDLLKELNGDASPKALDKLSAEKRLAAFAPEPTILPATDILFDAWAMTSITNTMPGRPPVAPYLHGVAEWETPQTSVAWRDEVDHIKDELITREGDDFAKTLLHDYPLKPHELLSDNTERIHKALVAMSKRLQRPCPVWIIDEHGEIEVTSIEEILNQKKKKEVEEQLANCIVLLPPTAGGLQNGLLNSKADTTKDVSEAWLNERSQPRRARVWDDEKPPEDMALVRTIDLRPNEEEFDSPDNQATESLKAKRLWHWYARPRDVEDATRASAIPITWEHHTNDVVSRTTEIVEALNLPLDLKQAVILAAKLHDLGKKRNLWQRAIGNPVPTKLFAKSGRRSSQYELDMDKRWLPGFRTLYRHEFGSLLDALDSKQPYREEIAKLSEELRDVVLHLIAAHHGYARPHFLPEGTIDPEAPTSVNAEVEAIEVIRRYARLQRKYGRWGLAYLESLLRAADWAASAEPSARGDES